MIQGYAGAGVEDVRLQNVRRSLLLAFTPVAVNRFVPRTREICNELIDAILARNTGHYGTDKRGREEENQVQR
jgi:cytochrome P450